MSGLPMPGQRPDSSAKTASRSKASSPLPMPSALPMPGSKATSSSSLSSGLPQPPGASTLPSVGAGLPQPPSAGVSLQQKDEEISKLKQQLALKDSALVNLTLRLNEESTQQKQLQEELKQQQETHKAELENKAQEHEAELAHLRDTTVSTATAMKTITAWEESNKGLQADLEQAQAQLKALPQVKAEDDESSQRLQTAQNQVKLLELQVNTLKDDIRVAREAAAEARKQHTSTQQAERAAQSELEASKSQCLELQHQLELEKEDFKTKFDGLLKSVQDQADQYIQDRKNYEKEIGYLKQDRVDVQDDGRHEHKRSRDSSHGRDSKRRR